MKKLLSIILVTAMLFGICFTMPVSAAAPETVSKWDGTIPTLQSADTLDTLFTKEGDVYLLQSAADVAKLAVFTNSRTDATWSKQFKLCCDIDMDNKAWPGIGMTTSSKAKTTAFQGDFDGDGHVVYNLALQTPVSATCATAGFFGAIATTKANIHDFGIASGNIALTLSAGDQLFISPLVGWANGGSQLKNCFNAANLSVTTTAGNNIKMGGLIGLVENKTTGAVTISDCWNTGDITYVTTGNGRNVFVGGIVGDIVTNAVTFTNVSNMGDVCGNTTYVEDKTICFGQLIGDFSCTSGTVITCTNVNLGGDMKMIGSDLVKVGKIIGKAHGSTINAVSINYDVDVYNDGVIDTNAGTIGATGTAPQYTGQNIVAKDSVQLTFSALTANLSGQNHAAGNKVRFNAELMFSVGAFSKTGYVVAFDGNSGELSGTVVYTSLMAIENGVSTPTTPTAGKYFISYGLSDIPATASGDVTVTPFVELADGTRVFGTSGTCTLANGAITFPNTNN